MRRTRAIALAGLCVLIVCGQAAGVTLRYQFKPGQVRKYKTMMTGAGEMSGVTGEPVRMVIEGSSVTKQEVLEVAEDGTATVEMQVIEGEMKMNMGGMEQTMPFPTAKTTLKMTPRGKATVEKAEGLPAGPGMQFDFSDVMGGIEFPEKDLKEGESWSGQTKMTLPMLGDTVIKFTEKFKGTKTVMGRECALIDFTFEAPVAMDLQMMKATGKVAGSGTMYFDAKNGIDVQTTAQLINVMRMTMTFGEQSVETKQTMKMNIKQLLVE